MIDDEPLPDDCHIHGTQWDAKCLDCAVAMSVVLREMMVPADESMKALSGPMVRLALQFGKTLAEIVEQNNEMLRRLEDLQRRVDPGKDAMKRDDR